VIALVDYGAGNLASVRKALDAIGAGSVTPRVPDDLRQARGIIVPGVGHFDRTRALDDEWRREIRAALDRGASLFGICLGMQWLFEGSDEAAGLPGLGAIRGRCIRLDGTAPASTGGRLKVPHVGWNSLDAVVGEGIMRGITAPAQVYFTHSYVAPIVPEAAAVTTYGVPFTSALQRGRIAGVQFHPEKSGDVGLRILKNWFDAV
jgi:glutamine amidotransferase